MIEVDFYTLHGTYFRLWYLNVVHLSTVAPCLAPTLWN